MNVQPFTLSICSPHLLSGSGSYVFCKGHSLNLMNIYRVTYMNGFNKFFEQVSLKSKHEITFSVWMH